MTSSVWEKTRGGTEARIRNVPESGEAIAEEHSEVAMAMEAKEGRLSRVTNDRPTPGKESYPNREFQLVVRAPHPQELQRSCGQRVLSWV